MTNRVVKFIMSRNENDLERGLIMNFLDKMERKYGKYAIRNLPMIMIAVYAAGYILTALMPEIISFLYLNPALVLRGQIWRVITWVLVPPEGLSLFTVIMLYFYFSLGRTLEYTWGTFRFNVYILSGVFFTVIGAFLLYFITGQVGWYSTYYINMSIFLAFALTYPDMEVLLMFIIPIKMKWMGYIYGFFILLSMAQGSWGDRISILMSLLNFVIFFLMSRNLRRYSPKEVHRRNEFKKNVQKVQPKGGTIHKCAVCGRTEKDGEHLEFRYCSKCEGNYEYCQDHLFTHQHVKKTKES